MKVNQSQLANVLGVSTVTTNRWLQEDPPLPAVSTPVESGGRDYVFETADCVKWMVERAKGEGRNKTYQEARNREKTAVAGLREYDLAERQRLMVNVNDVAARVEEIFAVVKSRLTAIPGRLAQMLAVESDATEVERLIKEEVAQALEELSLEDWDG